MLDMEDPVWFSPLNVIHHADELDRVLPLKQKSTKEFRKVVEARAVAVMLTGLITKTGRQYWMQVVDDKERSPDIKTICYAEKHSEKFDNAEYQDVEVVEYEKHSAMPLPEFLAQTKFAKEKGYDKDTHILCHLGKDMAFNLPKEEELKNQMKIINSSCPIVFLAPSNQDGTRYKLTQLNPEVRDLIEFNLEEELHNLGGTTGYIGVMHFKLGSRKPIEIKPEEKYYPFEKIGYVPDEHGNY
jgi:hypothetical protein